LSVFLVRHNRCNYKCSSFLCWFCYYWD